MRLSEENVRGNRGRVVEAASQMFRSRGFDGVAVPALMKAAGLTHGGFYNHFASKAALACAALERAWAEMAVARAREGDLPRMLRAYLSTASRDTPGRACPAAALAGDVRRQPQPVRTVFADGLEEMIQAIAAKMEGDPSHRRAQAAGLAARMVGALMLSRAVPDDHPLARELLDASLEAALRDLADNPRSPEGGAAPGD